jgi:hypothetical protein
MMLLCGLAAKNTPVFSALTSAFLQIGGNNPQYDEFKARTIWSLSNAFNSAFKELDPQGNGKTGGLHRGTAGPWLLADCGGRNGLDE